MALKIGTMKKIEPSYQDFLWSMVAEDQLLKKYFRQTNPIIKFELIDHSDSLNYWASIGQYKVCGSAFIHDFLGKLPDSQIESRFKISFNNVIRNLIVNVAHGDMAEIRNKLNLFDGDQFNIDAVSYFIKACSDNFTNLKLNHTETDDFYRWYFTSEIAGPFGIGLEKKLAQDVLNSPQFGPHANRCTKDHIVNLLVRSFIGADSIKESAAKHRDTQNVTPKTAKLMAEVREAVKSAQIKNTQVLSGLSLK